MRLVNSLWASLMVLMYTTLASKVDNSLEQLPEPPSLEELADMLGEYKMETLADLDAYTEAVRSLARLQIAKAFSAEARRFKRTLDTKSANVTGLDLLAFDIAEQADGSSWINKVTGFELLTRDDKTYFITGGPRTENLAVVVTTSPQYSIDLLAKFKLDKTSLDKVDFISAEIDSSLMWVALGSSSSRLVAILCINLSNGEVKYGQNIPTKGVVGALHMFSAGDSVYLVVGEKFHSSQTDTAGISEIYVLVDKYFDRLDQFTMHASGITSISGFTEGGNHFIIMGMDNLKGAHVYQLDPLAESLIFVQELKVTDIRQVLHYVDAHDHKHYVVILSQNRPVTIYWWDHSQFVQWQVLQTGIPLSASLGYITLNNLETIIFFADRGSITAYTDNLSGHYFQAFTVTTGCSAIQNMYGLSINQNYYLYYLCVGAVNRIERRVLLFHEVHLVPDEDHADDLLKCLKNANATLQARNSSIAYLEDLINNDRLMTTDRNQVWSGPIVFSELTVTATSTFTQTVNIININQGTSTALESLADIETNTTKLESEIAALQNLLSTVLYGSGNQTITGTINASSLIIDNLDVDFLTVNKLNGIKLTDFISTFLIDGVDQSINGKWIIGYLSVDKFDTRSLSPAGRINGFLTADVMRKSLSVQLVTGNHTYSTVVIGEICNSLCNGYPVDINGIDTSTIVLQGSDVTFIDKKTFVNIRINRELTADTINGIDLQELAYRIIYKDIAKRQTLNGRYTLSRVEVRGNVEASKINGVDFKQLDASVVKTTGNYRIAGGLVYETDLLVSSSLTTDSINGILWSDVVDLSSPDIITGMFNFREATILGSLTSNDINGIDLSKDVVLTDKQQTINGRIRFTQSIDVRGPNGVLLEIRGTVNGVDPSELKSGQQILQKIVITKEAVFSRQLEITGDVTAQNINGLLLDGIQNRYWSLTKDQVINTPVSLISAVFQGTIKTSSLNGRQLSDYLHTFGNELITGRYSILGQVKVEGDLLMDPGRTVDGVDVSEIKKNLVTLSGMQTITGRTTFSGKVTLVGDLDLGGKINGVNVTRDLMRLDQSIPHSGRLTFTSKTTVNILEIVGADLSLQTLNGLDLAAAAADVVLADEDAVITGGGGLQFTGKVNVKQLYVSGDVDGVNLRDLQSKALLKNADKPQMIEGSLLVDGSVSFDGGLTLQKVNGKVWSDYLNSVVTLDYSGPLSGRKIFTKAIEIGGNLNTQTINGIDIAHLASRILRRSGEQTIEVVYTFNQDLNAKALFAPIIDGVDMASILLIDVAGDVTGTVTFEGDVHLLNGLASDHYVLDGCNVREIEDSAVINSDGKVDMLGDVMVDRLIIRGSAKSAGRILAGSLDLKRFLDTLVLKSSDQVILVPVQFGEVKIDNLNVKTINSIDIKELFRLSVLMNKDNDISCDVKFANGIRVGNLVVKTTLSGRSGGGVLINGLDLSEISSKAVRANGGTVLISGLKTFTNGFTVKDLVIADSLGGVSIASLVSLSRSDILAVGLRFTAPISIRGNLRVTGLVDGVNLLDFYNNRVILNTTQTMFTSCTFESIRVEGDLQIARINDVLLSDLVIRSASSQTITSRKVFFGGLVITGNMLVRIINGLDFLELNRTLVRKDQITTINQQVTFNSVVTSTVDIIVTGIVNGFDLSELSAGSLTDILIRQYTRIDEIRNQFGSIREENYRSAREMFAALSYLERVRYPRDTNASGSIWLGRIPEVGPGQFFKLTTCSGPAGRPCGCRAEYYYYKLTDNAQLQPYVQLDYKVNIIGHALSSNLYISIYSGCFEGVPGAQVRVVYADGSSGFVQRLALGLISDSGLFIIDGVSYIVTVSMFVSDNDSRETTTINVLTPKLGSKTIAGVWSKTSTRSATDLDLVLIKNKWYLLVTNSYDASNIIDPYSANSELYVWDTTNKAFQLKGEYMADHATSGIFISVTAPVQEYFFSLAQYKAADFHVYEDNLKFTANVLIYRFNNFSEDFEPFQFIDVHGVMGQTVLRVDDNYYLLFISAKLNLLYVYQYYHSEGFVLYSTLRVKNPQSIAVLEVFGGTYVAVSTPDGLERFKVKTKGLDPDNLFLLERK